MELGEKYGRWTVEGGPDRSDPGHPKWFCRCDCGTVKWIRGDSLRDKKAPSTSCGCWSREVATTHGEARPGRRTKLYRVWSTMLDRCYLKTCDRYPSYGGRGIKVCEDWMFYENFRDWAKVSGYQENLSIERNDVNGNYEPGNCTWTDPGRQMRNMQNTIWLEAWGETKALPDWLDDPRCKVTYHTLYYRVTHGWPDEAAISAVKNTRKPRSWV